MIQVTLRFACYLAIIGCCALGFITIVATGGGGGGGDDSWLFPLWIPTDIVVSDVDGDGRNDILTLARLSTSMSHDEGHLRVYGQTDQGGFSAPNTYIVGEYPWQLVVGNIDDDDLPDLLVTDPDLGDIRLLLQDPNSNQQFLPPWQIETGLDSYYAALADLNNDGKSDIAISTDTYGSNRIAIFYHDPENQDSFLPATDFMVPGSASSNLATGDLNGDGLTDLLAWIYLEPSGYTPNGVLAISFQQPGGVLGPMTPLAPETGLNVEYLSIADYNGDGANDLFVFFRPFSSDYKAKLTVVLQKSQPGTFAEPVDTSLAGIRGIDDAVAADLNGDGRPDFAVVGFFPEGSPSIIKSRLNLFIQSGGGAFSLADVYDMPFSVSRVAAGDIDGDGLNDLVVLGDENECMVLIQSHDIKGTFNSPKPL